MKKLLAVLCLCLLPLSGWAAARGFGEYRIDDVNVRRSPGGPILFKKQQGEELYIRSQREYRGQIWYEVNTYDDRRITPVTAWVRADMVTTPEALFQNVRAVAAYNCHMIALLNDGRVVYGGQQHKYPGTMQGDPPQAWRDVRQVTAGFLSVFGLKGDGSVCSWGIRGPLSGLAGLKNAAGQLIPFARIDAQDDTFLGLMADGSLHAFYPDASLSLLPPDSGVADFSAWWPSIATALVAKDGQVQVFGGEQGALTLLQQQSLAQWRDVSQVASGFIAQREGSGTLKTKALAAAILNDGRVTALDEGMQAEVKSWTDVRQLAFGDGFLLGLTGSGQVLVAGERKQTVAHELADWAGVIDIACGFDFCVGVTQTGQLLFAGEAIFTSR